MMMHGPTTIKFLKLMVDFTPTALLPMLPLGIFSFNTKDARKREGGEGQQEAPSKAKGRIKCIEVSPAGPFFLTKSGDKVK